VIAPPVDPGVAAVELDMLQARLAAGHEMAGLMAPGGYLQFRGGWRLILEVGPGAGRRVLIRTACNRLITAAPDATRPYVAPTPGVRGAQS
jgi:hypothetical protein